MDPLSSAALERAREYHRQTERALNLVQPEDVRQHYSLARALRYALAQKDEDAGYESYCSGRLEAAGAKRQRVNSILIPPWAILRNLDRTGLRTLQPYQTTVTGSGAELVEETFRGDLFIDALRPRSVVLQLGAQNVNGLAGDVQIPRMDTTATAFWLTPSGSPVESGVIIESEGTFDGSPLTAAPCVIGGFSKVSRLLLQQTKSNLAETIIANDLARVLGTGLDAAAIGGSGASGTPTGIVNVSGVNDVSLDAGVFDNETAVAAVQDVATANAIISRRALGWATTPAVAGLLSTRSRSTTGWPYIWQGSLDTGSINGHPALSSNNVPAATAIFGDWSQLLILSWGVGAPLEVEVNPYQSFGTGDIGIRAMMSANIVVRHPQSFSVVSSVA